MINASLNWASLTGPMLILLALFTLPDSLTAIIFILGKRSDYELESLVKRLLVGIRAAGRLFSCALCGEILFFQGWRLDPILQFAALMLAAGIIFESGSTILNERRKWAAKLVSKTS